MNSASDNRAVLDRIYAAFAAGDFGSSVSYLDPHVVLVIDEGIPDGGPYLGVAGVRDYMTRFLEPWDTLTIEAESIEQAGDTFVVSVLQKGTGRGSQAATELRYFQMWTFMGEKVVRLEVQLSRAA